MILQETKLLHYTNYSHKLTEAKEKVDQLEFALKHFRDDPYYHCVLRKTGRGYVVYTDGARQITTNMMVKKDRG